MVIRKRAENTVSESTVSSTELSEFLSLTEFPLGLWFACQSELTEFFAELTEFAVKLSEAQWVLSSETVLLKQYSARFLVICCRDWLLHCNNLGSTIRVLTQASWSVILHGFCVKHDQEEGRSNERPCAPENALTNGVPLKLQGVRPYTGCRQPFSNLQTFDHGASLLPKHPRIGRAFWTSFAQLKTTWKRHS